MPDFTVNWSPTGVFDKFLAHLKGREGQRFLEIGVFEGQGTHFFFEKFLGKTGTMVCIDPFIDYSKSTVAKLSGYDHIMNESVLGRFTSNLAPFMGRIELHKDLSKNVLPKLPAATFDLAFVDGDHSRDAVAIDARECFRLVKKGGYIVFDDYPWGYKGRPETSPKDAIDYFLRANSRQLKLLHKDWCVIVQRVGP